MPSASLSQPSAELFPQVSGCLNLSHLPKPSGTVRWVRGPPLPPAGTRWSRGPMSLPFGVISTVAELNTRRAPPNTRQASAWAFIFPGYESCLSPLSKSCGPQPLVRA